MSLAADFGLTLTQHVLANQADHPDARGQLSALLTQIGVAGKLISAQVRRAGLIEVWGATGETNVQGERVQKTRSNCERHDDRSATPFGVCRGDGLRGRE